MALYPSLEDMAAGQMMHTQAEAFAKQQTPQQLNLPFSYTSSSHGGPSAPPSADDIHTAYPALMDMGLQLTPDEVAWINSTSSVAIRPPTDVLPQTTSASSNGVIAPISGLSVGYHRAQVTHGVREITLCKGQNDKVGMKVQAINKGIFIVLVTTGSPAAMVGLRFGDQILQIDGENVAGYSVDRVHGMIKRCPVNGIKIVVRDRPFERTITLHKDSTGHVGFHFKNGKIDAIVKDSSAARNGLLTEHQLLEVNGQNVVGLEDKATRRILEGAGTVVTLTIIPSFIYDHLVKATATSLVKKMMDHSIPDL